jgi:hypothetical protein
MQHGDPAASFSKGSCVDLQGSGWGRSESAPRATPICEELGERRQLSHARLLASLFKLHIHGDGFAQDLGSSFP